MKSRKKTQTNIPEFICVSNSFYVTYKKLKDKKEITQASLELSSVIL